MRMPHRHEILVAATVTTGWLLHAIVAAQPDTKPRKTNPLPPGTVLIPAGQFTMGHASEGDHNPTHKVQLNGFYIDAREVTNGQYAKYIQETGAREPEFWGMEQYHSSPDYPDHSVVGVAWTEAKSYCEWAGKRLPTEAEWECAARGGLVNKDYPHGDELTPKVANYWQWDKLAPSGGEIVAAGSYPPNAFGLYDMAGNVAEWVADRYDEDYYKDSPKENPTGPDKGRFRVIRGGGWHSGPSCNRVYYRNALPANWRDYNVGFRCAKDASTDTASGPTP
jgi:iron(II)-dependent oxidoreductase